MKREYLQSIYNVFAIVIGEKKDYNRIIDWLSQTDLNNNVSPNSGDILLGRTVKLFDITAVEV